jgi:glycosyltransferase involved in cell wall biosynthesis
MPQLMSITYASVVVMKDIETAEKMRLSKTFPPLACGVPVIHSGRGEAADLIIERNCGLCAPPDSPNDLQAVIRSLADDRPLRDQLGQNGRRFITEELSWETIITRWLAQLRELRANESGDGNGSLAEVTTQRASELRQLPVGAPRAGEAGEP